MLLQTDAAIAAALHMKIGQGVLLLLDNADDVAKAESGTQVSMVSPNTCCSCLCHELLLHSIICLHFVHSLQANQGCKCEFASC